MYDGVAFPNDTAPRDTLQWVLHNRTTHAELRTNKHMQHKTLGHR